MQRYPFESRPDGPAHPTRRVTWRLRPAAALPALLLTAMLLSAPFAGPQTEPLTARAAHPAHRAAAPHLSVGVGSAGWVLLGLYLLLGAVAVGVLGYLARRAKAAGRL